MVNKAIKNKINLEQRLDFYKKILNREMIEYLNRILSLEISPLNSSFIKEDIQFSLEELELYRDIVKYNIYKVAYNKLSNINNVNLITDIGNIISARMVYCNKEYELLYYNPDNNYLSLSTIEINEEIRQKRIEYLESRLDVDSTLKQKIDKLNMRHYFNENMEQLKIIYNSITNYFLNYHNIDENDMEEDEYCKLNPGQDDNYSKKLILKKGMNTIASYKYYF